MGASSTWVAESDASHGFLLVHTKDIETYATKIWGPCLIFLWIPRGNADIFVVENPVA